MEIPLLVALKEHKMGIPLLVALKGYKKDSDIVELDQCYNYL